VRKGERINKRIYLRSVVGVGVIVVGTHFKR